MKDLKYVIKRIIIGVGIGFLLMLIKGNVFADEVEVVQVWDNNGFSKTVASNTGSIGLGGAWNYWDGRQGMLYSSFSYVISGNSGANYNPILVIRYINADSNNGNSAPCHWSSYGLENATNVGASISFYCPVDFRNGGLKQITVGLVQSFGTNTGIVNYQFNFSDRYAMHIFTSSDMSSVTSAVQSTTNAINSQTQTIISQEQQTRSAINSNTQAIEDNTQATEDLNDDIMDSDTSSAQSDAGGFFSGFSSNSHGISGIISAPLRLLNSLSSSSCSPLVIPLPFVNQSVTIKCLKVHMYNAYFPNFLTIYQIITTGLIGYWVLINLFRIIKGLQDPDSDRIEVFDL